jgi:pimeloyl-ACP methyl ester carboxylesterase
MDRRGTGLSERLATQHNVAAGVEDLDAVRKALAVDRLWLLGASVGGTIMIDYAASQPQHVQGLLLYAVNVRGSSTSDYPWALTAAQLEKWLHLLQSEWGGATSLAQFAPSMAQDDATRDWWARMLRQSASRNGVHGLLRALLSMDVRDRLAHVHAPALIVQRQGDRIVREGAARYLAGHIAGARLALLAGQDHLMWFGDMEAVLDTMEAFVQEMQAKADA